MKRLRINLKPDSIEIKKKELLRQFFKKAILLEVAFLILVLAFNLIFTLQNRRLKNRLSVVNKELQSTESLLKERDRFLQYKEGYAAVFDTLKGIFKRDLFWWSILKEFSNLVPEEMWFNELALKEVDKKTLLMISASVGFLETDEEKLDKINSFIAAAKKDKLLSEYFQVPDLNDVTKAANKLENRLDLKFSFALKK